MTERTEERLRAALRAETEDVSVDPDAWSKVQRRAGAHRSRSARAVVLVAAGILLAVVGTGAFLLRDDDTTVEVTPADDGTTTSTVATTTTTSIVTAPAFEGIWPFASQEEVDAYVADPGVGMFRDAEQTALEFAREYLGMPDPVALDGYVPAEGASGSVTVVPRPGAPMRTTIWLHAYDGVHTVYFAEADNIRPGREAHGVTVDGATVTVSGTSTAFEAHVDVEVRDADGTVLGRSYVMGGASGELEPFEGSVTLSASPSTPTGAVILSTSSAEDGSLSEATVIQVTFGPGAEVAYSVWFHREEELVEVRRVGPRTAGVLRQALEALVAGPTPYEQVNGLSSLFSEDTADVLAGVTISNGTAVVDLAYTVPNASASAGSAAFLAELDATIFQFPTVDRIEYRLEGSCDAFWEWLQYGDCRIVERP